MFENCETLRLLAFEDEEHLTRACKQPSRFPNLESVSESQLSVAEFNLSVAKQTLSEGHAWMEAFPRSCHKQRTVEPERVKQSLISQVLLQNSDD